MKTYDQLMLEVMSMSDMKKIPGGTDKQRQIAQDRQKRREVKDRSYDNNQSVINNKPNTIKPSSSAVTKTNPNAIKKSGSLVKTEPKKISSAPGASAKRSTSSPGSLVKKPAGALNKKPDNKVQDLKVKSDDMVGQRGNRPGTTKPTAQKPTAKPEKKEPTGFRKGFSNQWRRKTAGLGPEGLGKKAANLVVDAPGNLAKRGLKTGKPEVKSSGPKGDLAGPDRRTANKFGS